MLCAGVILATPPRPVEWLRFRASEFGHIERRPIGTHIPSSCDMASLSISSANSISSASWGEPGMMLPFPPRPVGCTPSEAATPRDAGRPVLMLPTPPRPDLCCTSQNHVNRSSGKRKWKREDGDGRSQARHTIFVK